MSHKSTTRMLTLTSLVIAVLHITYGATDSSNDQLPSLKTESDKSPLSIEIVSNMGKPGALLYDLESVATITLKYQLNCTSVDVVHTILASTSDHHVAVITDNSSFDISCNPARSGDNSFNETDNFETSTTDRIEEWNSSVENSSIVNLLRGEVRMTVNAKLIGRSFLILHAQERHLNLSQTDGDPSSSPTFHWLSLTETTTKYSYQFASEFGQELQESQNSNQLSSNEEMPTVEVTRVMIIVMKLPRTLDKVFRIVLYNVIIMATIGMGVKIDFVVIRKVLKNPVAPVIGLCCQYICMPVIAYGVARVVPQESAAVSLGIFTCGIVPGGGMSNMFTYLLGGDLSLSATMTTMSNIAALGLLPAWLFTLGNTFQDETSKMHVPYVNILEALAISILPLFLGMLIKYKLPKLAVIISKVLKPVLIVVVTFSISLGIYTNFYIFKMIRPMTLLAGCLLPYIGYLIGGFVSFVCFRTWTDIKTIAIETGIQNTGIAFLILFLSLQPPDNQLAAVAPAASAIMTPQPLFIAVLLYTIYQRCTTRKQKTGNDEIKMAEDGNGNAEKKESQDGVDVPAQEKEKALIVVLWRILTGRGVEIDSANGKKNIKELDLMLPQNDKHMKV
ncbi:unnamed protein product [Candidula unifasciata]|uniref:Ileal sodium/bile acid cotransporter n=1 Tax=Candidula unifasciata TaxID=100452 RepID=A0A8S3Z0S1_9EUPU|nr:unnamed protein product [Candidula unifasciata]